MRTSVLLSAALLLATPTLLAHADTFTLTGGSTIISFSLPASPTPSVVYPGQGFAIDNVSVTTNNTTQTEDVTFFPSSNNGALCISGDPLCGPGAYVDQSGPKLYSGSESNPTFLLGTFNLDNYAPPAAQFSQDFTLKIAPDASTVTPEPSSLLLLGTGLVSATGLLRRRLGR